MATAIVLAMLSAAGSAQALDELETTLQTMQDTLDQTLGGGDAEDEASGNERGTNETGDNTTSSNETGSNETASNQTADDGEQDGQMSGQSLDTLPRMPDPTEDPEGYLAMIPGAPDPSTFECLRPYSPGIGPVPSRPLLPTTVCVGIDYAGCDVLISTIFVSCVYGVLP